MNSAKEKWIDNLLGKMNSEQKVGQLLVFGFTGPVITPDIVELIQKYNLGGLRISQMFRTMNAELCTKSKSDASTCTGTT